MAPQTDEPPPAAAATTSRDSLVEYLNGGRPPTRQKSVQSKARSRTRRRACPIVSLLGLLAYLLICGSGVAISILVVYFNLQVLAAGSTDTVARILLFVASCMGLVYVLLHACAAREHYVRSRTTTQMYGSFSVSVAVLIQRLGVPVWLGAVVLNAIVAAQKGLDTALGIRGNVVWVQLGITALGLIFVIVMVVVTEITDRPFATYIFSSRSFIQGTDSHGSRTTSPDLLISRPQLRHTHTMAFFGKGAGRKKSFDTSTITVNTVEYPGGLADDGTLPDLPSRQNSRRLSRVRSQPIPTPLEGVFMSESVPPHAQNSPRDNGAHMAWRPPVDAALPQERSRASMASAKSGLRSHSRQSSGGGPRPTSSAYSSHERDPPPEMPQMTDTSPVKLIPAPAVLPTEGTGSPVDEAWKRKTLTITNPDPESPVQESSVQEAPVPTLAKLLSQLSTRAAARRRLSLHARQMEQAAPPRQSNDAPRADSATDMTAVLFEQPTTLRPRVQPGRPPNFPPQRQDSLVPTTDLARTRRSTIFFDYTTAPPPPTTTTTTTTHEPGPSSPEFEEVPPSDMAPRDGDDVQAPPLVRNFSRPGTAPRPRTAGGGERIDSPADNPFVMLPSAAAVERRGRVPDRERRKMVRRSRSLPNVAQRSARRPVAAAAAVASHAAAAAAAPPKFSAFPKTPTSAAVGPAVGLAKVRGLGQGSTRRLDERVAQWRSGVRVVDDETNVL